MYTYQDYLSAASAESTLREFLGAAVRDHQSSAAYRAARDAEEYYARRNVTITQFQKFLYTMSGRAVPDNYSANYKTKTAFFRTAVISQVQYVLSNGIFFGRDDTKARLGADFDYKIVSAAKRAMIDGVSFVFYNFDHVEVFGFADTAASPGFVPLYDEDTSQLRAGIRYWYTGEGSSSVLHLTLYNVDGYADFAQKRGDEVERITDLRGYITRRVISADGVTLYEAYDSYPGFPIVPMYANDLHESELCGLREAIDCYDYIKNGLANDIDDAAGIYWTIKNSGGFDDLDMAKFLDRLRTVRAASVMDDGADIEAHTLSIPTEARTKMLEILRTDLYRDAMLLDVSALSASAKTATEIRAAYQAQDDKCGDFEYLITDAILGVLKIAGIDDTPTYKWNRIANMTEETEMVLLAASYLDDEAILNHLPWLTPEEVSDILDRRAADDMRRIGASGGTVPEE